MAQDLTPRPKAVILRPREAALTPSLPPGLRQVIESGLISIPMAPEAGGGIVLRELPDWAAPTIDPALHAVARAAREALLAHLEPMEEDRLGVAISLLLAHRWRGRGETQGNEVQQALLVQWIEDLEEFPEWAIHAACRRWRRGQPWHPTIADIRGLCEELVAEDRRSLRLLTKLLTAQRRVAA